MEITTNNKHSIINYLNAAKELNSFVKNNFSKKEREGLCIASIIDKLHVENDKIERDLCKFNKANIDEYVHKDMYLKGSMFSATLYLQYGIMHIINRCKSNKFKVECINIPSLSREQLNDVDISKETHEISAMDLIEAINHNKIVECSKEEYEEADKLYIATFSMLERYANKYKK